jgi:hypothetical protein
MEAAYFSETSVSANKTACYHNAEEYNLNIRCCLASSTTTKTIIRVKLVFQSSIIHQDINMPKE